MSFFTQFPELVPASFGRFRGVHLPVCELLDFAHSHSIGNFEIMCAEGCNHGWHIVKRLDSDLIFVVELGIEVDEKAGFGFVVFLLFCAHNVAAKDSLLLAIRTLDLFVLRLPVLFRLHFQLLASVFADVGVFAECFGE